MKSLKQFQQKNMTNWKSADFPTTVSNTENLIPNTVNSSVMKVKIPLIQHQKVKHYAHTAGLTQGQVIEMILQDYFFDQKKADILKKMIELED